MTERNKTFLQLKYAIRDLGWDMVRNFSCRSPATNPDDTQDDIVNYSIVTKVAGGKSPLCTEIFVHFIDDEDDIAVWVPAFGEGVLGLTDLIALGYKKQALSKEPEGPIVHSSHFRQLMALCFDIDDMAAKFQSETALQLPLLKLELEMMNRLIENLQRFHFSLTGVIKTLEKDDE